MNTTDIEAALDQMGGFSDDDSTVAKEKRGGGIAENEEGDTVSAEPLKPLKERATAFVRPVPFSTPGSMLTLVARL